jgi:hypothetical protein
VIALRLNFVESLRNGLEPLRQRKSEIRHGQHRVRACDGSESDETPISSDGSADRAIQQRCRMELPAVIRNRRKRLILVASLCDMKMAALKGGHSHLDIEIIGLFLVAGEGCQRYLQLSTARIPRVL